MQFSTCTRISKNKHAVNRAIILFTQHSHYLWYFSLYRIACGVLMALVFYYNDMLQKVTMQRTQQFSAFVCYRKNPVKCNACAVARKIETDCFTETCHFLAIQSLEFQEIWKQNRSETTWMIYHEKSGFWHREFLIIQETINGEWRKSPMSKFY